jgi:misacylated tRNA(Ala) deacylase
MTATTLLFRDNAYLQSCEARVLDVTPDGGVIVDQTVFYPQGGGQPGDLGEIEVEGGPAVPVVNTMYGADRLQVAHRVDPSAATRLQTGQAVRLILDWDKRHRRMRTHTALHLLSVVLPYPVTGGSIGDGEGRLDFDIQDAGLDKAELTDRLNALIAQDAAVTDRWITDEELDANPGLVKTMSVQPPRGSGRVRLVEIAGIDLQPCGGTHVRRTGEIGTATITDIEKKGKQNRRVRISLA